MGAIETLWDDFPNALEVGIWLRARLQAWWEKWRVNVFVLGPEKGLVKPGTEF